MIDSENGDNEKDELAMNVDKTDYHEADSELGSWFQRQGDTCLLYTSPSPRDS